MKKFLVVLPAVLFLFGVSQVSAFSMEITSPSSGSSVLDSSFVISVGVCGGSNSEYMDLKLVDSSSRSFTYPVAFACYAFPFTLDPSEIELEYSTFADFPFVPVGFDFSDVDLVFYLEGTSTVVASVSGLDFVSSCPEGSTSVDGVCVLDEEEKTTALVLVSGGAVSTAQSEIIGWSLIIIAGYLSLFALFLVIPLVIKWVKRSI